MATSTHRGTSGRLRRAATGLLCALALGTAGCTTDPAASGPPPGDTAAEAAQAAGDPTAMTPIGEAPALEYLVPEAPDVVPPPLNRGTLEPPRTPGTQHSPLRLRPGATYRLPVVSLPPELSTSHGTGVLVQLTVSASGWTLEDTGLVKGYSYLGPDVAGVRAFVISSMPAGGCDRLQRRFVGPGPEPMDLAMAIPRSYGFDVVEPARPVSAFGFRGVHVILRLAEAADPERCLDFNLLTYRPMASFSERVELWILEAHGTRVVIERSWFLLTPATVLEQQHAILASLAILPE